MVANDKLFLLTELAEASYANLRGAIDDQESFRDLLKNDLGGNSPLLSSPQAADLASHWEVAAHQPDTLSGFSATLFRSLDNEGYVLACRGTASGSDYAADLGDIVRDGIALCPRN
nr:hypothetical protein [uncultured Desulfobulbus sp.]